MKFATLEEIILIHDGIIEKIGGSLGLREPELLKSIIEKPATSFGGHDLYETIYDKASAFLEALCNYHVFVDGNKRTSIAALEYFLFINDYLVEATQGEKENFVLSIATKKLDMTEIATWIKSHTKKK